MELVAFLGKDTETWGQVNALVNRFEWEKVIILKNKDTGDFVSSKEVECIQLDTEKPLLELKKDILEKLKGRLSGFEAALSLASGNGKEHMALISALLSIPVGVRLVVYTKEGVEFIN